MFLEFAGQSARDTFNRPGATSRLINCFREPLVGSGGSIIRPVLGLSVLATLPRLLSQALAVMGDRLFTVCGGRLYEVSATGAVIELGEVSTEFNEVSMAGNDGILGVVSGGKYYALTAEGLMEAAPGAFTDFGSVTTFGGYTILTERGGRRFQWSELLDATDLPGLNFSTADGRDDKLLRALPVGGQLLLLKETSHEWWYQTGGAGAEAFERVAGGVGDLGLGGFALITRMPSGAFMIGDDGKAYVIARPGAIQPVSTPPVETAIREMKPVSCLYYEDEGHMFCCIVFRDAPAWCFDIATGEWHERAEGSLLAPWTAVHSVKWRGGWHASQDDGTIRRFARSATDGDKPLVKQATSHTIRSQDGQRMVLRELEIHAPQGFSAGRIGLQISRDGGATFGLEKPRDIGPIGAYAKRMNWRNLGLAREMCARVQWTDDVAIVSQARVRL